MCRHAIFQMFKLLCMVILIMNYLSIKIRFVNSIVKSRTTKAAIFSLAAFFVLQYAKVQGKEEQQQLWLISSRCAPLSGDLQSGQKAIRYWRFSPDCQWQPADEESFHAGDDPAVPTTIVIPGNREDADDAIEFAWPIYRRMLKIAQDKPFRLAIWSWPSDQIYRRNRPDVQLKFSYCDMQSYYLAAHLEHYRADAPLCLIGYSMGAHIIAGGLQLLAGGEVDCRKLPGRQLPNEPQKRTAPLSVVTVAAAIDDDSLASDGTFNLALSQVESMLVVRNGCDKVLKWYPRIYGRHGPEALGFAGPAGSGDYKKIELLDVSCEVGRAHKWEFYLTSQRLLERIDRYAFPSNIETDIISHESGNRD